MITQAERDRIAATGTYLRMLAHAWGVDISTITPSQAQAALQATLDAAP